MDTLTELRELYPEGEFYLLTGSDMFCTVLDWHRGSELVRMAEICTMERGGDTAEMLETQAGCIRAAGGRARILHREPFNCSSTGIRERIAAGCPGQPGAGDFPQSTLLYPAERPLRQ